MRDPSRRRRIDENISRRVREAEAERDEALAIIDALTAWIDGVIGTGRPTNDPEEIALYNRIDRLKMGRS